MFDYKKWTRKQNFDSGHHLKFGTSVLWILIVLFLYSCAWTYAQCPRQIGARCKGPYVIRPVREQRESHQCRTDQQSAMMSCMQKCQADACCRAFGLGDEGECVTSSIPVETLHSVKEIPGPVQFSCIQG